MANNNNFKNKKFPQAVMEKPNAAEKEYSERIKKGDYQSPMIDIPKDMVDMSSISVAEVRYSGFVPSEEKTATQDEMYEVIGIKFKSNGKIYYFNPENVSYNIGDFAVVETARGQEFGEVGCANKKVDASEVVLPLRSALRKATEEDIKHKQENKEKEREAFELCEELINKHKLPMKLVEAEYTFDNTKLLFYFTSDVRVDFRELVKDLASVFKTRIELRQIGIRDEARMLGGIGTCGRPFCCKSFLNDFAQVSIKMAKEQGLSLNSVKISGTCGRLMCCLRYEHDVYEEEIKKTPRVDSVVRTADGDGVVTETSPLTGMIKVRLNSSPDTAPKAYHRDDVKQIGYAKNDKKNAEIEDELKDDDIIE